MPTGYTAGVESGEVTEFRDFALTCARAFGALIEMRDEPMNAPIPEELGQSDHYTKAVKRAQKELAEAQGWSEADAEIKAAEGFNKAWEYYESERIRNVAKRERYLAMLEKVHAWTPPTSEHKGLKEFMIEQLEESIKFDCYAPTPPHRSSGKEFKEKAIQEAKRSLAFYTKAYGEEKERVAGRNAWVKALRESLAK